MKNTVKHLLAVGIIFLGVSAIAAQPPSPETAPGIEKVYLAKDDGTGKAGEEAEGFSKGDVPIYCVVLLDSTRPVTVKMIFIASDVPGVKRGSRVVTASYKTKDGENRVNFTGRPDKQWTPGKYRVNIYLEEKFADFVEFEITPDTPKPKTAAPESRTK